MHCTQLETKTQQLCFFHVLKKGITKPCIHLHPAPSIFTQLISASTQFSLTPSTVYKNQIIARNWAISPNLGRKTQSCPFCLKTGTHGILEVLIQNPELEFWNSTSLPPPEFESKKQKLSVSHEIWYTWYFRRDDFESGVRFSKFRRQNPFSGKFWPKKHSLFILIWDLAAVFWHSSAASNRQFWKYEVPKFLFYSGYIKLCFSTCSIYIILFPFDNF